MKGQDLPATVGFAYHYIQIIHVYLQINENVKYLTINNMFNGKLSAHLALLLLEALKHRRALQTFYQGLKNHVFGKLDA